MRSASWNDRFAIGLSALCIVHCLVLPVILIVLPSIGLSFISNELTHLILVYAVVPSSIFALGVGCTQHRRRLFLLIGAVGLSFLGLGLAVESLGMNPFFEKLFTVSGALIVAYAHFRNFKSCRESDCCHPSLYETEK